MRSVLALLLFLLFHYSPAQMAKISSSVKAGSEGGAMSLNARARYQNGERIIPANAQMTVNFRALSGMKCRISLTSAGAGTARISSGGKLILSRPLSGKADTRAIEFSLPTSPPTQTVSLNLSAGRGQRMVFYSASFSAEDVDLDNSGYGDAIERLVGGPGSQVRVKPPANPRSTFQTGAPYEPKLDLFTDAVLVYSSDANRIKGWADRGYRVQTMGGFRDYQPYAEANPQNVQRRADGSAISIANSFYLAPTEDRLQTQLDYYRKAIQAGSTAVAPEEPEYWADAGYEEAFKAFWRDQFGADPPLPHSSPSARWQTDRFKANLMADMTHSILKPFSNARRMIAVHSPINYPFWRIAFAHHQTLLNPLVQDAIGQVWSDTVRTEIDLGRYPEEPFLLSYAEYASLAGLTRGTGKNLWFLMDPLSDAPTLAIEDCRRLYATTLVTSLFFTEAQQFEVLPWPERIFGRVPTDYATTVLSGIRALESAARSNATLDAGTNGIAAFFSDTMAYQRGEPSISRFDGFFANTFPLIERGIPVQMLSMERMTEPNYAARARVGLASFDYMKPDEPHVRALADWVKRGNVLVLLGGTDPYNDMPESWWRQQGRQTPSEALFAMLGIEAKLRQTYIDPIAESTWIELGRHGPAPTQDNARRWVWFDLAEQARQGKSVYLRLNDPYPSDGFGPHIRQVRLELDGRVGAAFFTGSQIEEIFLYADQGSKTNRDGRFADGNRSFTYRFNLPKADRAQIGFEIAQQWEVSLSEQPPFPERAVRALKPDLQGLKLRNDEPMTFADAPNYERLFESDEGALGFVAPAGQGAIVFVGIAPDAFGRYPKSDDALRSIVKFACQRANLRYIERPRYIAKRGEWHAIYATTAPTALKGLFVDALDPNLAVMKDPTIPIKTPKLLLHVSNSLSKPALLHSTGKATLVQETASRSGYYLRGPLGVPGAARIALGKGAKIEMYDATGNPAQFNIRQENGTALVRWDMRPEGCVLIVTAQ